MEKRKIKGEKYIRKKIRKLEKKLEGLRDEEDSEDEGQSPRTPLSVSRHTSAPRASPAPPSVPPPPVPPPPILPPSQHRQATPVPSTSEPVFEECDPTIDEDQLPEEFLLALGTEGEEKLDIGEAIRPELAARWSRIMTNGLGKEAREAICKKYLIPSNFQNAKAPTMNPEIMASFSEITKKRDMRISLRQNLTGKLLTCLGRSLTNLLKGNINSKMLIEETNDAAKIAAEIFNQDSSSRKFFALSGATQTIKEAVKDSRTDELLFGKDCGEKIKSAQTMQRTGAQIKATAAVTDTPKPSQGKVGNWRGPPQQQHHQARGGRLQSRRQSYNTPHQRQQNQRTRSRTSYRR